MLARLVMNTCALRWRIIDLVILDMMMPGMSGRDLFLALQAINVSVKRTYT